MADSDAHKLATDLRHIAKEIEEGGVAGISLVAFGKEIRTITSVPPPGMMALAFLGTVRLALRTVETAIVNQAAEPKPSPIVAPNPIDSEVVRRSKR